MRYRQLSPTGDYTIGLPFYANSPNCVGQAVSTRLKLLLGEWYANLTDGTPYFQDILGKQYGKNPDAYIKQRILGTPGVESIVSYQSTINSATRKFTVTTTILTIYSEGGSSTTTVTVSQ